MDNIVSNIVNQIPMLIMSVNNGVNINNLIPVLFAPLIIHLIQLIIVYIGQYFQKRVTNKIPKEYVNFCVEKGCSNQGYRVDFSSDLYIFLNRFCSATITSGIINQYNSKNDNPDVPFKCHYPVVSPENDYFIDFTLDQFIIKAIEK